MEDQVRQAALQAIASWQNGDSMCEAVHTECAFLIKTNQNREDFVSFLQDGRPAEPFLGAATTAATTTGSSHSP
eukprot:scaffold34878_cov183-Amphora_coffeaeformis.AAC.1